MWVSKAGLELSRSTSTTNDPTIGSLDGQTSDNLDGTSSSDDRQEIGITEHRKFSGKEQCFEHEISIKYKIHPASITCSRIGNGARKGCTTNSQSSCNDTLRPQGQSVDDLPGDLLMQDVFLIDQLPVSGGGNGDVYRGKYRSGSEIVHVALKVPRYFGSDPTGNAQRHADFVEEALTWNVLKHPRIVPFLGVETTIFNPRMSLVSKWMPNDNISKYLYNNSNAEPLILMKDVAEGLLFIHSRHFVHGDIKPENILVDEDGRACLSDLGASSLSISRISHQLSSYVCGGTTRWMAPELFEADSRSSYASDVYAFGMTMYGILAKTTPFRGITSNEYAIPSSVVQGLRPRRPDANAQFKISEEVWSLIEKCWRQDSKERCSVEYILSQLNAIIGCERHV